jgi:hypothetical protein
MFNTKGPYKIKEHNLENVREIINEIRSKLKEEETNKNIINNYIKKLSSFPIWYIFDKDLKDVRTKFDHILKRLYISINNMHTQKQINNFEFNEMKEKLDNLRILTLEDKPNPIHHDYNNHKRKKEI